MGFWIFMTCCNLLIPILMIIVGWVFLKHPPKTINGIYGYRTSRSMKNIDTWNFAHAVCGKIWWRIGWCMLPVSLLAILPVIGKNDNIVGLWGGVITTVECVVLIAAIFPVERALKERFGDDRKNRSF